MAYRIKESLLVEVKPAVSLEEAASSGSRKRLVLKPKIEAIHAGLTRNFTFFGADKLQGSPEKHTGVHSWLYPVPKPILTHHQQTAGEPIGRVVDAIYTTDTKAGKPGIVVTAAVVDQDAVQKILDQRYLTVSVGGITEDAFCSICGQNLAKDGWCGHERGKEYDGQLCYVIIGDITFEELSFVNVPADAHAQVVDMGQPVVMECLGDFCDEDAWQAVKAGLEVNESLQFEEEDKKKDKDKPADHMRHDTWGRTNFAY